MKKFWKKIISIFKGSSDSEETPTKVEQPKVETPVKVEVPKIEEPIESDKTELLWTREALLISMRFEGDDPWANITGNFDGVGLTCGGLGWTIKWNNQQPLVKKFVNKEGLEKLKELMPKCWEEYWSICNDSESSAIRRSGAWSGGRSLVREPYNSELRNLWKHPTMISIQVDTAWEQMGKFAWKKTIEGQKYFKLEKPKFGHFAYWFDLAVHNGTGKLVAFSEAEGVSNKRVLDWCKSESGAGQEDTRKNAKIWEVLVTKADFDEVHLWKMAMLRAVKANDKYDTDVMNRKGSLALGEGIIHGKSYSFPWVKLDDSIPPIVEEEIKQDFTKDDIIKFVISLFEEKSVYGIPYKNYRETKGKNRSPEIDKMILAQGGNLGEPYCIYGIQSVLDEIRSKFNVEIDLPETGSSQSFWSNTKSEYKIDKPCALSIGIYQNGNSWTGHGVIALSEIDSSNNFKTFEFNTSASGNDIVRDGQGAGYMKRPLKGYGVMHTKGFVDIFKAIKRK